MDQEPDIIAQTAEAMTDAERLKWLRIRISEAHAKGATFLRASRHPDIPNLTLLEAWKAQPDDQGEPRWQLSAVR